MSGTKKCAAKLIFFRGKELMRKIQRISHIVNWLWKSNLDTFWHLPTKYTSSQNSIISFGYVDSYAKIFLIFYPLLENLITTTNQNVSPHQLIYVSIFFFFFSVIGSAMTFGVFDKVNLDIEGSASYCPAFLYRFTYSTAILVSLKL